MLARASDFLWERISAPVYSVSEAARYANTAAQTVSYWHRGAKRGPAIQRKQNGRPLSYLELAEMAFVAVMRSRGVSLQRIRRAREYLLDKIDSEYPFATIRFKTEGVHILMDLKDFEPGADEDSVIVADEGGQTAWSTMLAKKFHQFDYEDEIAMRWYPRGKERDVFIDPRIAFGEPNINGIPTKAIRGRAIAGESFESIQSDYGLTIPEVRSALRFEGIDEQSVPLH